MNDRCTGKLPQEVRPLRHLSYLIFFVGCALLLGAVVLPVANELFASALDRGRRSISPFRRGLIAAMSLAFGIIACAYGRNTERLKAQYLETTPEYLRPVVAADKVAFVFVLALCLLLMLQIVGIFSGGAPWLPIAIGFSAGAFVGIACGLITARLLR